MLIRSLEHNDYDSDIFQRLHFQFALIFFLGLLSYSQACLGGGGLFGGGCGGSSPCGMPAPAPMPMPCGAPPSACAP